MVCLTELQQKVSDAAKEQLKEYKWFRGVCVNDFPSDQQISEDFEGAVTEVAMTTAMWDSNDFFDLNK
jgi:hypothetical protein